MDELEVDCVDVTLVEDEIWLDVAVELVVLASVELGCKPETIGEITGLRTDETAPPRPKGSNGLKVGSPD